MKHDLDLAGDEALLGVVTLEVLGLVPGPLQSSPAAHADVAGLEASSLTMQGGRVPAVANDRGGHRTGTWTSWPQFTSSQDDRGDQRWGCHTGREI